jgi:hypothetical protein
MRRVLLIAAVLWAGPLASQASPYVPLDDPRLPLFEHLVGRGDVRDPSPQVRPFRRADALESLLAADTAGAPLRRLIQELRAAWVQDTAIAHWGVGARAGVDAHTSANRDPLHRAGDGWAWPYGELTGNGAFGPVVVVSRTAIEPRLDDDPDWPGRKDLVLTGRMAEAYLSGQWRFARLFYGAVDRQWGPNGVAGIPLSAYAYPRSELALDIGTDRLRLSAHAAQLADDFDSTGARVHRFWFAHRLAVSPSRRLAVALWETTIISGAGREFEGRWRNPASLLLLSNQYGLGADGNILVGADVTWWATPRLRLESQIAIDDINYPDPGGTDQTPSRYAFTVAASGPLARTAQWKLLYTQASSLAFRTQNESERYTDGMTGLGRGYGGNDQTSLFVSFPVGATALVTPELTYHRQGEGRLADPYPSAEASAGDIPALFVGTVEKTLRVGLGVSGARGRLQAAGRSGLHYVADADHVAGRTRTELVADLRITIGIATGGRLQ